MHAAGKQWKGEPIGDRLMLPAAGLEAEFALHVDGRPAKPEEVFGDPRGFIRGPLMHRTGRSFHLPNAAAVYFDTGVIEIATPAMELERGCFGRLARSLDTATRFVRGELDAWERRTGRRARLQGFSAHYNVSVEELVHGRAGAARMDGLAWLLAHVLPAPVMLLATNCRSTGVGVRPRPRRLEITVDFTPDPLRVAATGAVIAGIAQAVGRWPDLHAGGLAALGVPVVDGFSPMHHTTRRGWLARFDCYPLNPFECSPDAPVWTTAGGAASLRGIAQRVMAAFDGPIRRIADVTSYRLARRIVAGAEPSWLDRRERPAAYDDVGREARTPEALERLGLSRYERVLRHAVDRRPVTIDGRRWRPEGVRGWSRVLLRREEDGARAVLPIDTLVGHLERWG